MCIFNNDLSNQSMFVKMTRCRNAKTFGTSISSKQLFYKRVGRYILNCTVYRCIFRTKLVAHKCFRKIPTNNLKSDLIPLVRKHFEAAQWPFSNHVDPSRIIKELSEKTLSSFRSSELWSAKKNLIHVCWWFGIYQGIRKSIFSLRKIAEKLRAFIFFGKRYKSLPPSLSLSLSLSRFFFEYKKWMNIDPWSCIFQISQ